MKKVLFIDRDGTLIVEPTTDYQVDSIEKLEFLPKVFTYLGKIAKELDYELVIVTNQDGLGTDSFPENTFWPTQNKMLKAFENEGIIFADIHIDRTFENQNAPTRKPNIGMLSRYLTNEYDLNNSFVIGDRLTDIELAKNLGAKSILINHNQLDTKIIKPDYETITWEKIYQFLVNQNRLASIIRNTNETKIKIDLNLDGNGMANCKTGLHFFDHMLDQIARHAGIDLNVFVDGDLEVDEHHTIEDTGIALGNCFKNALGKKVGIERYGFTLPMDDCLAQVALDFGGRNWLVWKVNFKREKIGDVPTEMFEHFFKSFSDEAKCNLNIQAEGENEHHKIESIFKAFAKAIKMAIKRDTNHMELPSTKGSL